MRLFVFTVFAFFLACSNASSAGSNATVGNGSQGPTALFNGEDLSGWDVFLGPPSNTLNAEGQTTFCVVIDADEPAISVDGSQWGALISHSSYRDFRLRAEYRWGRNVWPPLNFRDAGIMYYSIGPPGLIQAGGASFAGPGQGSFMVSVEYQIAGGTAGSAVNLGPVELTQMVVSTPAERPEGVWNDVEIECRDRTCKHFLNGELVVVFNEPRVFFDGRGPRTTSIPLYEGKIQLQSESADVLYRRLYIERL